MGDDDAVSFPKKAERQKCGGESVWRDPRRGSANEKSLFLEHVLVWVRVASRCTCQGISDWEELLHCSRFIPNNCARYIGALGISDGCWWRSGSCGARLDR